MVNAMKLSIERLGSRSGSQFKLMYDGLELCRTNSQKNAMYGIKSDILSRYTTIN
jgi:hypothetical protein